MANPRSGYCSAGESAHQARTYRSQRALTAIQGK
jgi:hypothetical protein